MFRLVPPSENPNWGVEYKFNFDVGGEKGDTPFGGLIQTGADTFYGMTSDWAGIDNPEAPQKGTIFRLDTSPDWFGLDSMHHFDGSDGAHPFGSFTHASDGYLYGTTALGGAHNSGVIFRMDSHHQVTVLHEFNREPADEADAAIAPNAPPIEGSDGHLYGTAAGALPFGEALPGTLYRLHVDRRAAATLTLSNLNQSYDGTPKSATVTTTPAGLSGVTVTYNGSTTPPSNIGSYALVASLVNADYKATNATGTLIISSPAVTVTLSTASVVGGTSVTATVTLTSPAPNGGAVVNLASNAPGAASVPATLSIMKSKTTKTFTVTTFGVTASTPVTISASYGGTTATAALTVNPPPPPTPSALGVNPKGVIGGSTSTATVTLTGPAPAGGLLVTLTSSMPSIAAVTSVTVPAGSSSATAQITTVAVTTTTSVTITATGGGVSRSATLVVRK